MKRSGLDKARVRLKNAFRAHASLKSAKDWDVFQAGWADLLTNLNAVYEILGASSRDHAESRRWYAGITKQRKSDEALNYLHHARNANEQGIAEVLQLEPGAIGIGVGQDVILEEVVIGPQAVSFRGGSVGGEPLRILRTPDRVTLIPVIDRGVEYLPPASFLGTGITGSPLELVNNVLEFMAVMFLEAESLVACQGAKQP